MRNKDTHKIRRCFLSYKYVIVMLCAWVFGISEVTFFVQHSLMLKILNLLHILRFHYLTSNFSVHIEIHLFIEKSKSR